MNLAKLVETVTYQLEAFSLLQSIDECVRDNDAQAIALLDAVYARKGYDWRPLHPFIRLNTTLSLLIVPVCFLNRATEDELNQYGMQAPTSYGIDIEHPPEGHDPSITLVVRVLRNALAHLPDFAAGGDDPNNH
jgi:hypothetical protein